MCLSANGVSWIGKDCKRLFHVCTVIPLLWIKNETFLLVSRRIYTAIIKWTSFSQKKLWLSKARVEKKNIINCDEKWIHIFIVFFPLCLHIVSTTFYSERFCCVENRTAFFCCSCIDRYWILMNSYISFNSLPGNSEQLHVVWEKR